MSFITRNIPRVGVIDCGCGNYRSLSNALLSLSSIDIIFSSSPSDLSSCTKLILPGVGSFSDALHNLQSKGLTEFLLHSFQKGTPTLGICLGMQLLFQSSSEGSFNRGLGILDGDVCSFYDHPCFDNAQPLLVPHVGWNYVRLIDTSEVSLNLFQGIASDDPFYFTHSFSAPPTSSHALGHTTYGSCTFTSVAHLGSFVGVQFHPELSKQPGLRLLSNFLNI